MVLFAHLLSQPSLLVCDIVYCLDHPLKVSILAVLHFQGPNLPLLPFPNNMLADTDIDYYNLWDGDHPD
jgi:hypothetical protein